jgi:hypothetical protein
VCDGKKMGSNPEVVTNERKVAYSADKLDPSGTMDWFLAGIPLFAVQKASAYADHGNSSSGRASVALVVGSLRIATGMIKVRLHGLAILNLACQDFFVCKAGVGMVGYRCGRERQPINQSQRVVRNVVTILTAILLVPIDQAA